jgi:hypothetical protein
MDDPIITRDALRRRILNKAYIAFITRAGHDSHGLNPGESANDFEAEYKRLEAEARQSTQLTQSARRRVDVAQAGMP